MAPERDGRRTSFFSLKKMYNKGHKTLLRCRRRRRRPYQSPRPGDRKPDNNCPTPAGSPNLPDGTTKKRPPPQTAEIKKYSPIVSFLFRRQRNGSGLYCALPMTR
jgi:hypothetical protein